MENNFNQLKSEGFVVSDLKRQMGNARFFVARSCSILKNYRLACKLMGLGEDRGFEEKKFTRIVVNVYGIQSWYLGENLHRRDGPAIKWDDGDEYRIDGKRHRVDGPAVEWFNGYKAWWFEDKKHRVDGPAVVYPDGSKEWWVEGERVE